MLLIIFGTNYKINDMEMAKLWFFNQQLDGLDVVFLILGALISIVSAIGLIAVVMEFKWIFLKSFNVFAAYFNSGFKISAARKAFYDNI